MKNWHPKVVEKIAQFQRHIKEVKLTQEDLLLTESIMPNANIWLDNEVNVVWYAKSVDDVKTVLRLFAQQGILLESFNKSDTTPVWYLQGKKVRIRLCPSWSKDEGDEGATCKLVQVGENIVRQPVYKLMCDGKEIDNGKE